MAELFHFPLCPFSRRIRLALGEIGYEVQFREERPWDRRHDFLMINPAGTVPTLVEGSGRIVAGVLAIGEYLDELAAAKGARRLIPGSLYDRAEVRRLIEWFDIKFHAEVTWPIVHEKIDKRFMPLEMGGGGPNMDAVRAGKHNVRHHLQYIAYLTEQRRWLAGDDLSHADLAAAAHLSCVDFVGDVPWDESPGAKHWYARIKSRPSFRPLLADQMRGLAPPEAYADLDF
jgi:glutathione S-transferase